MTTTYNLQWIDTPSRLDFNKKKKNQYNHKTTKNTAKKIDGLGWPCGNSLGPLAPIGRRNLPHDLPDRRVLGRQGCHWFLLPLRPGKKELDRKKTLQATVEAGKRKNQFCYFNQEFIVNKQSNQHQEKQPGWIVVGETS